MVELLKALDKKGIAITLVGVDSDAKISGRMTG